MQVNRRLLPMIILVGLFVVVLVLGLRRSNPLDHESTEPLVYHAPKGYVCYRASGQMVIDGQLDKPAWADVPWTDDFVDIEGDSKPKPRFRTRAKMLWDDQFFYLAAELEEPHVWATIKERDEVIFRDNDFEIFIDPDGDNHEYYEFEMNALNTVWDLYLSRPYRDGGGVLNNWDIKGMKSAVHVDGTLNNPKDLDRGWTLEVAFPWSALKEMAHRPAPPRDGDQWRLNFSRVEWETEPAGAGYRKIKQKEDNWVWSPQGAIDMHRPETWGYVQFSTAPVGSVSLRADPSGPARQALMALYQAQADFRRREDRYAKSLVELNFPRLTYESFLGPLSLETTTSLYEASLEIRLPEGVKERWHVRHDSRLWKDGPPEKGDNP